MDTPNRLLALLLLSPLVFSEELEYPVKLTCEVGGNIFYFNLSSNVDDSWWKHHSDNYSNFQRGAYAKKMFGTKNNILKIHEFTDRKIMFSIGTKAYMEPVNINRLTGQANIGIFSGKCFSGFKEYSEKLI